MNKFSAWLQTRCGVLCLLRRADDNSTRAGNHESARDDCRRDCHCCGKASSATLNHGPSRWRCRHRCGRHNNHLQTQPIKILPNDNQVSDTLTDANVSDILTHLTAYDAESVGQRKHRGDRFQGVSLQPIVHVNVRLPTRLVTLSFHDHPSARFACFFVHFLRSVVRLECF